jgi:hypothetical protein
MVSFRTIFTSALALSAPVMAAITPAQVVDNIKMLTQKSQALQAPAQSLTVVNGPLIIIGQGPFPVSSTFQQTFSFVPLTINQQIITGFTDIVSTATTAISQMQGMAKVPAGANADAIFNAFREVCFNAPPHKFTCNR